MQIGLLVAVGAGQRMALARRTGLRQVNVTARQPPQVGFVSEESVICALLG